MKPEWISCISRSQLDHLVWIFTPGHAGVNGNERADKLAGSANVADGQHLKMGERDVLTALRERRPLEEGVTVDRLRELGVRPGCGSTSTLSGNQRFLHNQLLTGTVSRRTLSHVLAGRTERMWTCPECYDVISAIK